MYTIRPRERERDFKGGVQRGVYDSAGAVLGDVTDHA